MSPAFKHSVTFLSGLLDIVHWLENVPIRNIGRPAAPKIYRIKNIPLSFMGPSGLAIQSLINLISLVVE